MNLVKSLPLNNLLVGVVVPIAAAWISYYLAERAISKKENSRLYIQIELIKRELKINDDLKYIYSKFICKKFYFAERARRGNSGRKLIESYGVANTILYDHGGTTLDK